MREILPVVANVKSKPLRTEYSKKIAATLALDEQITTAELEKFILSQQSHNVEKKIKLVDKEESAIAEARETILRMIWHDEDVLDYILQTLPQEIFTEAQREILNLFETYSKAGKRHDLVSAEKDLSPAANAELTRILMSGSDDPRTTEVAFFGDAVNILRRGDLKKKYDKLRAQAESISSDKEAYKKMILESIKIKHKIDNLKIN